MLETATFWVCASAVLRHRLTETAHLSSFPRLDRLLLLFLLHLANHVIDQLFIGLEGIPSTSFGRREAAV